MLETQANGQKTLNQGEQLPDGAIHVAEAGQLTFPSLTDVLGRLASEQGLDSNSSPTQPIDTLAIYAGQPLTHRFVVGDRVVETLKPEVVNGPFGIGGFAFAFDETAERLGYDHGILQDHNSYVVYPANVDPNGFARRLSWQVLAAENGFGVFEPKDLDFLAMAEDLDWAPSAATYKDQPITVDCSQAGVRMEMLNFKLMSDPVAVAAFRAVATENKLFFCNRDFRMAVLYPEPELPEKEGWFAQAVSDKIEELNQD